MSAVTGYFLRLVAAALIVCIVLSLAKTEAAKRILRICCGAFIMLTALAPLASLRRDSFETLFSELMQESSQQAETAQEHSEELLIAIIKQNTEAYILDKAGELGAAVTVKVQLRCDGDYPVPESVRISGVFTQAQRQKLEQEIETALGIQKENQTWRHA